jgi:hypothetical protein
MLKASKDVLLQRAAGHEQEPCAMQEQTDGPLVGKYGAVLWPLSLRGQNRLVKFALAIDQGDLKMD